MRVSKLFLILTCLFAMNLLKAETASKQVTELSKSVLPIPLDADKLKGEGIPDMEPWPAEIVTSGGGRHGMHQFFSGEFVAAVYQTEPTILSLKDYPFDEFVYILDGKLVLTPDTGNAQTFVAGESLIVPKGFTGTWEMKGHYRELLIIETGAFQSGITQLTGK